MGKYSANLLWGDRMQYQNGQWGDWYASPTTSPVNVGIAGVMSDSGAIYACCIKITVPNFVGVSDYISMKLGDQQGDSYNRRYVQYALCSSDANKDMYATTSEVTEENQIAVGTFGLLNRDTEYTEVRINTRNLLPGHTYYLFLYPSLDNPVRVWCNLQPTISYDKGLVNIDIGSSHEYYQCCIDNGANWDFFVLHAEDGTAWDMYNS